MWETGLNSGSSLFSSRSHKRKGGSRTTFTGRHTSGHREQTCHCDFILHPFSTHLLPAKKAHWNSAECMLTTNEHEMLLPWVVWYFDSVRRGNQLRDPSWVNHTQWWRCSTQGDQHARTVYTQLYDDAHRTTAGCRVRKVLDFTFIKSSLDSSKNASVTFCGDFLSGLRHLRADGIWETQW